MVHKAQVMGDGNSVCSDGQVLIGQKKNSHGGSNAQRAEEGSADARRGENTLMGDKGQSKILDPSCFGDVNTHKVAGDESTSKIDPHPMGQDINHIGGQDINKKVCHLVVDNCININLPMDQSSPPVNHSSSSSLEEKAEQAFLEGTHAWLGEKRVKMVTSPPASGDDLDKIAQHDEIDDEHSDKVAHYVMAEHKEEQGAGDPLLDVDNDDEHSEKVAQDVTEEHKEEHRAGHDDVHSEKVAHDVIEEHEEELGAGAHILFDPYDDPDFLAEYDDLQQLTEVYERLALYRIKAHELLYNEKELDIAQLKVHYPPDVLADQCYYNHLEESLDWYFKPEYCKRSSFDDYQWLVLKYNNEYKFFHDYQSTCSTLKSDLEFLQFYEELLSKVKSVEDDAEVNKDKHYFRRLNERFLNMAYSEAPKIAARFCNISIDLVSCAIEDCTFSSLFYCSFYKDFDGVFFEIWKRVAKQKMNFTDALRDVYELDLYPLHRRSIKSELEDQQLRPVKMKNGYDTYVAHINEKVPEHEARLLIQEAVTKFVPIPTFYVDYIRKKLEVAREIGLLPQSGHS